MSEVLERNLTTPQGLYAEEQRLAKMMKDASAKDPYVSIGQDADGAHVSVHHAWLEPKGEGRIGRFKGGTWAEAIGAAEQGIRNWQATRHDAVIRKMALAVIELTDEHTHCTVTLLRGKGFSERDITEYSARACERASEMCGNAPFVVEAK
jgi:hypothetical protein